MIFYHKKEVLSVHKSNHMVTGNYFSVMVFLSVVCKMFWQVRNGDKPSWCIAKPSTNNLKLYDNIDYSCKQNGVDCIAIAPGGKCFNPNNAVSHASMAMNLYYKAAGKHTWNCHFNGTGMIVLVDPCKCLMLKQCYNGEFC